MIKFFITAALLIGLVSCNSDSNAEANSNDSTTTEIGGVENVNGNIPDTSAMGATPSSGSNQPHIDSSYADSAKKPKSLKAE